jgi:hypothetical protein
MRLFSASSVLSATALLIFFRSMWQLYSVNQLFL